LFDFPTFFSVISRGSCFTGRQQQPQIIVDGYDMSSYQSTASRPTKFADI